jgi:hypothetical protein
LHCPDALCADSTICLFLRLRCKAVVYLVPVKYLATRAMHFPTFAWEHVHVYMWPT